MPIHGALRVIFVYCRHVFLYEQRHCFATAPAAAMLPRWCGGVPGAGAEGAGSGRQAYAQCAGVRCGECTPEGA